MFCSKCGKEAPPGPWPLTDPETGEVVPPKEESRFTRIDARERYDLGHCPCTPEPEQVALVNDQIVAEMVVAERKQSARARLEARDAMDPNRKARRLAASKAANAAQAEYRAAREKEADSG